MGVADTLLVINITFIKLINNEKLVLKLINNSVMIRIDKLRVVLNRKHRTIIEIICYKSTDKNAFVM